MQQQQQLLYINKQDLDGMGWTGGWDGEEKEEAEDQTTYEHVSGLVQINTRVCKVRRGGPPDCL